jgi:predicted nucleic acid-binding protein
VTLVYFDASALVKLVVDEEGSNLAAALWDGCDTALSSRLSYPEVRSALAAGIQDGRIEARARRTVERDWEAFWSAVQTVELTSEVGRRAGNLADTHALSGADAIHLSSALAIGHADLVVAVWDRRLRAGVVSVGLQIAPL